MDLALARDLAARYSSQSQVARIVTEHWASRELYCPSCTAERLEAYPVGTQVHDFFCPDCNQNFQVKAKRGAFGRSVSNSAFESKMRAIREGNVPNYVFLSYDAELWRVVGGFVVPGHFISPSVIRPRPPLGPTARRAGWVGSNIILGDVPRDGRVRLIDGGIPRERKAVRNDWQRFAFLRRQPAESRGWMTDVLRVVRGLGTTTFHLSDVYAREAELAALHPANHFVTEKIRQQVFAMRDKGILRSLGQGNYEVIPPVSS